VPLVMSTPLWNCERWRKEGLGWDSGLAWSGVGGTYELARVDQHLALVQLRASEASVRRGGGGGRGTAATIESSWWSSRV
jgi:hypothetical protein